MPRSSIRATVAALLFAAPAAAEGAPPVRVTLARCTNLRPGAVAGSIELELRSVMRDLGATQIPMVELDCASGQIEVRVRDPVTQEDATRRLAPIDTASPEGPRMVGAAIAELFSSSWRELLLPPEKRERAAARPVDREPGAGGTARLGGYELAVGLGGSVHPGGAPWYGFRPALTGAWTHPSGVGIFLGAVGELASVPRDAGAVSVACGTLLFGATLRAGSARSRWSFQLDPGVGISLASMRGSPSGADRGDAVSGWLFDLQLSAGPRFDAGPLDLLAAIQAGARLPRGRAGVEGETAVELSGLFAGVSIGAAWRGAR